MKTAESSMRTQTQKGKILPYLNAMIMCPLEETGFAFSRYAVKLSSRQRTSAWVEPGGKEGERGEFGAVWDAVATMPHIGQPALGENEAISLWLMTGEVGEVDDGRGMGAVIRLFTVHRRRRAAAQLH
jgi:hypothetical protein